MPRTLYELQCDFASSSCLNTGIMWDTLATNEYDALKQKIRALIPDTGRNNIAIEDARNALFANIWAQRKYTNRTLLSAIIYVMVTEENTKCLAKQSTKFSCHPVFRTPKCYNLNNNTGCCMIFIDEHSRVYESWNQYLASNVLPKGLMVAPKNGIYTINNNNEVELVYYFTPKSRSLLHVTDNFANVGGIVATVPLAAAVVLPVAAPILALAGAVATTTAVYTTMRSMISLNDRYEHQQSITFTDRSARSSWLGFTGGIVGLGAGRATKALLTAANAGREVTLAAKLVANGFNISSILLSGTGIVNGVHDIFMKIDDDEELCSLDILQLTSSLIIFTNSINNFRMASKVAAKKNGLSMRSELIRTLRKRLDKLSTNTSKQNSVYKNGKYGLLQILNDIPTKDVLMDLNTINKHLRGGSSLNSVLLDIAKDILFKYGIVNKVVNIQRLEHLIGQKCVSRIQNFTSFVDIITALCYHLCEQAAKFLINLAKTFIEENLNMIERNLPLYISTESVLYKLFIFCIEKYTDFSFAYLYSKKSEILKAVEEYFQSLNPDNNGNVQRRCATCKGYYVVCEL